MVVVFINDIGAVAAEPGSASASRCRAVLAAIERLRSWLDEREKQWLNRLGDHDPVYDAYDWAEEPSEADFPLAG